MPAIRTELRIEAESYEPHYWIFLDNITGDPLDLTQAGFTVWGDVVDNDGGSLLALDDTHFQRTDTGRVYFAPSSTESLNWQFIQAHCQFYLVHPSGQSVRFQDSPFNVSPKV